MKRIKEDGGIGRSCPKEQAQGTMGNLSYQAIFTQPPLPEWGPACTTRPFPYARGSPSHRHRLEQPQEKPIFAFSQLTLRLRNAGSPPVWLPGEAAVCGGMSPFGYAVYFLNICGRKQELHGGMWGQGWAGRAGQQSIGRGSAGDGGQPALPNHPMCPCDTQPSSATSLMDGKCGCGSPS